jgi:hypothetical protein
MAHFAEVRKSDNKILRVIVISNEDVAANGGDLSTQAEDFVNNLMEPITSEETYWKQTSYNKSFRKLFGCRDGSYDPEKDEFIEAKPELYPSWVLDTDTNMWKPPLAFPADDSRPNNGPPEDWYPIWDEDLWNSSDNKNGWVAEQNQHEGNVDSRDDNKYYRDEETLNWIVKND